MTKRKLSDDSDIAPKRARAPPVSLVNLSDEEVRLFDSHSENRRVGGQWISKKFWRLCKNDFIWQSTGVDVSKLDWKYNLNVVFGWQFQSYQYEKA